MSRNCRYFIVSVINLPSKKYWYVNIYAELTDHQNLWYQITIFAFLPELGLHLLITTLGEFVIFFDITGSERNRILRIISIYRYLGDIWFLIGDICNIKFSFLTTIYCVPSNLTQSHIYDISNLTIQSSSTLSKLHNLLMEGAQWNAQNVSLRTHKMLSSAFTVATN